VTHYRVDLLHHLSVTPGDFLETTSVVSDGSLAKWARLLEGAGDVLGLFFRGHSFLLGDFV